MYHGYKKLHMHRTYELSDSTFPNHYATFIGLALIHTCDIVKLVTVKHSIFSGMLHVIWRHWSVEISLNFNLAFSQGVLCNVKCQVTLAM